MTPADDSDLKRGMRKGAALTEIKKRREFLHRQLGELRRKLKELEARVDEVDSLWNQVVGRYEPRKVTLVPPCLETNSTSDLILIAVSEFERVGIDGVERAPIMDMLTKWSPAIKPNTLRVAFKRLIESGRIEKMGNLYRSVKTEAATSEKAAA